MTRREWISGLPAGLALLGVLAALEWFAGS